MLSPGERVSKDVIEIVESTVIHLVQSTKDSIGVATELSGTVGDALWHAEPVIEAVWCTEGGLIDAVWMHEDLMEASCQVE